VRSYSMLPSGGTSAQGLVTVKILAGNLLRGLVVVRAAYEIVIGGHADGLLPTCLRSGPKLLATRIPSSKLIFRSRKKTT
jgi:hypothetical protein